MIVDFQHHYTPPELLKQGDAGILQLDAHGNPVYKLNPLLADLPAHIRMMDHAGIDTAVLSCGSGFDQPSIETCRLINDRMRQAEEDYPCRFIGLGHVPALDPSECAAELKRCAVELGFPGVVIASELQGQALDAETLRPFWRQCAELDLYVYLHPLPRVIAWPQMYADDLGRMLGWEFSLMVAVVRMINSGLFDEFPNLRVHVSHFGGGIGRYLPRIRGLQDRERNGTVSLPNHGRAPRKSFDHYLEERIVFDCCGWSSADNAAEEGALWVGAGLTELPNSRIVFATDYPQGVQDDGQVASYVSALRAAGDRAFKMLEGADAHFLIRDLHARHRPTSQ